MHEKEELLARYGILSEDEVRLFGSVFEGIRNRIEADAGNKVRITEETLFPYLRSLFQDENNEVVYLLLFDGSFDLCLKTKIGIGTPSESVANLFRCVKSSVAERVSFAVLVHNHPNGRLCLSDDDRICASAVKEALHRMGVTLDSQMLVAGRECKSFPV